MSKESGTAQVRNTLWVEMLVRAAQYSAVAQKWIRDSKGSLAGRLDLARARLKNRASVSTQDKVMIIGSHDHNREGATDKEPVEVLGYGSLEHRKTWPNPRVESFRLAKPRARMETNIDHGRPWSIMVDHC